MFVKNGLFSSESVSPGHPDKIADQLSDAILDAFLAEDPYARVACECFLADQKIVIAGEFHTDKDDLFKAIQALAPDIARQLLRDIGYSNQDTGIDPENCEIQVLFNRQSPDIANGLALTRSVLGAGDQGLMFGYATRETENLMPAPLDYAHRLLKQLERVRQSQALSWLQPDAKAQVTFEYKNHKPTAVRTIVLSTQHTPDVQNSFIRDAISEEVIEKINPRELRSKQYDEIINPSDRFVIGGPKGDVGLTGRKIIVDTYGGAAPHGGGAFSGKDPSKVDRSGAYMARYLARQALTRGWADRCLVQLAYAIGRPEPVSLLVTTERQKDDTDIANTLLNEYDLTPTGIIEKLDLRRPIYFQTAVYGHFGRPELGLPWESEQ
jgi:S-adenosylmethionine synthetase